MGWLSKLFNLDLNQSESPRYLNTPQEGSNAKRDAYNRLKLVLMHDRTHLSPDMIERMRDDLVAVISKYVEIDKEALELNLETESTTVALVANIPVLSTRQQKTDEDDEPSTSTAFQSKPVSREVPKEATKDSDTPALV